MCTFRSPLRKNQKYRQNQRNKESYIHRNRNNGRDNSERNWELNAMEL